MWDVCTSDAKPLQFLISYVVRNTLTEFRISPKGEDTMTINRDETSELWLFWIPNALAAQGVALPEGLARFLASPFNPAAFGPTVAALLLTLR